MSNDERRRVHLIDERLNERLPRHLHDRAVKVDKDHALDAEQAADQLPSRPWALLMKRDLRAKHERVRCTSKLMTVGMAPISSARDRAAHERGVADMDAVKKAQGNDTFLVFHTSRNLEKLF